MPKIEEEKFGVNVCLTSVKLNHIHKRIGLLTPFQIPLKTLIIIFTILTFIKIK